MVRIGPTELAMLEALADREKLSVSEATRHMIRRVYAEHFGTKVPKPSRKG
jgi:hypothetical protein